MPIPGSLVNDCLLPEFSFSDEESPFLVLLEDKKENANAVDFPLSLAKPAKELKTLLVGLIPVSLSAVVTRRLAVLIVRFAISSCEAF